MLNKYKYKYITEDTSKLNNNTPADKLNNTLTSSRKAHTNNFNNTTFADKVNNTAYQQCWHSHESSGLYHYW